MRERHMQEVVATLKESFTPEEQRELREQYETARNEIQAAIERIKELDDEGLASWQAVINALDSMEEE